MSSALVLAGCTRAALAPGEAASPAREADRVDADAAAPGAPAARDEPLAAALERALDGAAEWPALRLFTECRRDAGLESLEIFGNGVAILNDRRQFVVSRNEIATLLASFQRAGFAAMPDRFGGKTRPADVPEPPREGEAIAALRVICRVELSVGGHTKRVAQLDEGEQSEALKELSEEFFRVCEGPARSGVGASDLADGLAKIGRGELAPETLHLMLHRKPEGGEPESAEGFLLRLDGLRATTRPVGAARGLGSVRALELGPDELEGLARELAASDLAGLPINLYADHYTDLTVEVLDRKASIQARRFAGLEPDTHGELQERFDGVYARLRDLNARVAAHGAPVAD